MVYFAKWGKGCTLVGGMCVVSTVIAVKLSVRLFVCLLGVGKVYRQRGSPCARTCRGPVARLPAGGTEGPGSGEGFQLGPHGVGNLKRCNWLAREGVIPVVGTGWARLGLGGTKPWCGIRHTATWWWASRAFSIVVQHGSPCVAASAGTQREGIPLEQETT